MRVDILSRLLIFLYVCKYFSNRADSLYFLLLCKEIEWKLWKNILEGINLNKNLAFTEIKPAMENCGFQLLPKIV